MKKTICIDLDGVLACFNGGWKDVHQFGPALPGAAEFTKKLAEHFDIVIYTVRCTADVCKPYAPHMLQKIVKEWLDANDITYHDIYIGQGKPLCSVFIDDNCIRCRPGDKTEDAGFDVTLQQIKKHCHIKDENESTNQCTGSE